MLPAAPGSYTSSEPWNCVCVRVCACWYQGCERQPGEDRARLTLLAVN
jgi:hypothetical protein